MDKNINKVEKWILKFHPGMNHIPEKLDLIETRLIDSLRFIELILLLEQLSGKNIDMNNLNIDNFRTLDCISEKFLTHSTPIS